jgi:uncharacterized protein
LARPDLPEKSRKPQALDMTTHRHVPVPLDLDEVSATIPARQIDFSADLDAGRVPAHWFATDPYATAVVSGLSVMFPDGEAFFVEAVRACRDLVPTDDERLLEEISAFVLQEAMHGKGHRAFNEMLAAQGSEAVPLFEAEVRRLLGFYRARAPKHTRLAITCALEHFTAILAEELLGSEELRGCFHPSVAPMWIWHAIEETEHKAVAFDVYQAAGGGYLHRCAIMVATTITFLAMMVRGGYLFRVHPARTDANATHGHDPEPSSSLRDDLAGWGRVLRFVAGENGVFRRLLPSYLDYFRPSFHPRDRDASELVSTWRARLFGSGGPLDGRVTPLARPKRGRPVSPGVRIEPAGSASTTASAPGLHAFAEDLA